MSDMPERIWLDWPGAKNGEPIYTEPPQRDTQAGQTEYVRADIVQALTAERDRLREALECLEIAATGAGVPHPQERKLLHEAIADARAALKGETQ